jgi:hypothetical protein
MGCAAIAVAKIQTHQNGWQPYQVNYSSASNRVSHIARSSWRRRSIAPRPEHSPSSSALSVHHYRDQSKKPFGHKNLGNCQNCADLFVEPLDKMCGECG